MDGTLLVDGYAIYRSNRPAITVTELMAATRDAAAAPGQRSYAEPGRLTLEVQDDFSPWNSRRFALEGGPEGAACRPTDASPDLTIARIRAGLGLPGRRRFHPPRRGGTGR